MFMSIVIMATFRRSSGVRKTNGVNRDMKNYSNVVRVFLVVGFVWLIIPQSTVACPYCFGNGVAESSLSDGMRLAILTLLGVTATVLGAFAAFFLHLVRKSKSALENPETSKTLD